MRKLFMGALAMSATFALVGGAAVAQAPEMTFKAFVSPSDAGTPTNPKNTKLRFQQTLNYPGTTVEFIDLRLPRGLKMSGKGLGNCTATKLEFDGPAGCADDKAGPQGTATALLGEEQTLLQFTVQPFVQDRNTLVFYVASESGSGIAVQSPITGEITDRGRKLRITIPLALRQPVTGVDASLTGLDQSFSAKKGSKYLVSSVGCKDRKHRFKATLIFAQRADGNPIPDPLSGRASAPCKK